jgi:DNA helicase-2/ATP-dependent DNA helicase PcrA
MDPCENGPARAPINYGALLNPQQCAAVKAPPGPALVIAGAGSGKTRTLTYRVAYLIENGISPRNILLLTFTNKAAREMVDRVNDLIGGDSVGLWGGTFHSIGNRILRLHAETAGYRPGFSILDREDQESLLDAVIRDSGINPKESGFPKGGVLADIVSMAINTAEPVGKVLAGKYPYFVEIEDEIEAVWKRYEERKRAANAVDFDDLLAKTASLLRDHAEIAQLYQDRFQFVLVDEYQDTNQLQAEFVNLLAARHKNLMVVGDDAQSIYSWRGADYRNILEFPERYPDATVFKIETNYRSIPEVLEVANAAIAANVHQFRKNLRSSRRPTGFKPAFVPVGDANEQARFVVRRIRELRNEGVDLDEVAILYRAHFHSMELQMELTRHGVPFRITSGIRFFEQAHVKDVAAFLKFAVNPRDEIAFKRMVRLLPGVGARSAEQMWADVSKKLGAEDEPGSIKAAMDGVRVPAKARKAWEQLGHTIEEVAPGGRPISPADMIESVIEAVYDEYLKENFPNYEQRKDDLDVLANYARQELDPVVFLEQLALLGGIEEEGGPAALDTEAGMVNLSSVHQAKGLEWRAVFVLWMADGMFPGARSLDKEDALEEERRLFYVAVTRARDELYLIFPQFRFNAGPANAYQRPSRFLSEIPKHLLQEWRVDRR